MLWLIVWQHIYKVQLPTATAPVGQHGYGFFISILSLQIKTAHFLPSLFPSESELAPDTEGTWVRYKEGMAGVTVCERERGGRGTRAGVRVCVCVWARIRKFMPSEDNYVTLSLNNLRGSVHPRKIFLIDRLSASLYIRRREGGVSHCCAWSPPECGCSAPKWTLRFCTHEVSRRYHFI